MGTRAGAALVDGTAEGDEHEPAGGVGDLLTFEDDRVETLPGNRIAGVEIAAIELHPRGEEAPSDDRGDFSSQGLELGSQEALGAVAADGQRAHPREITESCELGESYYSVA